MLLDKKDNKELTDKQRTFLSVLFSEADGDPRKAAELAGYAPTSYPRVVQGLKDEIIERAESVLAAHSPQAALGISRALTDDGSIPGASIRLEVEKVRNNGASLPLISLPIEDSKESSSMNSPMA